MKGWSLLVDHSLGLYCIFARQSYSSNTQSCTLLAPERSQAECSDKVAQSNQTFTSEQRFRQFGITILFESTFMTQHPIRNYLSALPLLALSASSLYLLPPNPILSILACLKLQRPFRVLSIVLSMTPLLTHRVRRLLGPSRRTLLTPKLTAEAARLTLPPRHLQDSLRIRSLASKPLCAMVPKASRVVLHTQRL